ncbi:hypothetical protein CKO_03082 [Citrobacter koseri ATCC BAA-895]|uniref:Uncharacterized protein n=1 Tax=Citrobacter koseri (strain ATCC BAA-895 / CDC 4225-83 / SGSC4696) TaxID=290338 RepID=A8AL10_CITK8|nr:hypothetical protein CKO_03082 [Citrobacter koseri ATCC BAA-895]
MLFQPGGIVRPGFFICHHFALLLHVNKRQGMSNEKNRLFFAGGCDCCRRRGHWLLEAGR